MITGVLHIVGITIFWERMPASYYLIGIMLQFFLTVGVRFSYRFVLLERNRREKSEREERSKNVMIIGAGEAGRTIVRELQNAKETNSRVRCLIDDNPNKWGRYMEGVPVVGGRDDIFLNVDKYHINQILLAIPTATPHQKRDILNICKETGCELKQLPGVYQLVNGEVSLAEAITEKTKVIIPVDLGGVPCDYDRIFSIVEEKKKLFHPANQLQEVIGTKSISPPDTCTSPESRESIWSRDTRSSSKWQKKGLPATYITNHCR